MSFAVNIPAGVNANITNLAFTNGIFETKTINDLFAGVDFSDLSTVKTVVTDPEHQESFFELAQGLND